jgi:ABC-type multidrug transport system fused ATPase/permease subunit
MHIFTRITRLFLKYKGLAALSYLSLFAGAALSMAIPKLTGRAIDLALGSSAVHL